MSEEAYVVHGAQIKCSCGLRPSTLVVPLSHGVFIQGHEQLNIEDYDPIKNGIKFGGCTSPENPSVKAAAQAVVKEMQNEKKGFLEKVVSIFCKPKEEAEDNFVNQCAGECTPVFAKGWQGGKEIVLIEGDPALLKKSTLTCIHKGEITIMTTGQPIE